MFLFKFIMQNKNNARYGYKAQWNLWKFSHVTFIHWWLWKKTAPMYRPEEENTLSLKRDTKRDIWLFVCSKNSKFTSITSNALNNSYMYVCVCVCTVSVCMLFEQLFSLTHSISHTLYLSHSPLIKLLSMCKMEHVHNRKQSNSYSTETFNSHKHTHTRTQFVQVFNNVLQIVIFRHQWQNKNIKIK